MEIKMGCLYSSDGERRNAYQILLSDVPELQRKDKKLIGE
jgi:hypothetical protein